MQINLASDGFEQYFYILELYILPALVIATIVLFCGYIVGRIFNRRSKKHHPAKQPSAEMRKEEGTAAFLKELRSTPPIRDSVSAEVSASGEAGAIDASDGVTENAPANGGTFAEFRLAPVAEEEAEAAAAAQTPAEPAQALPAPPALHADRVAEPAITSESTATAAALLARISRKKSASARRLSDVLDARERDMAAAQPASSDAADGGAGRNGERDFSALLADAKNEALDRVPEALLRGELPKEAADPHAEGAASSGQSRSHDESGSAKAGSGQRRSHTPNFSLLAMVPDAGAEAPDSTEEPVRKTPAGSDVDEVLDLTLEASPAESPDDAVLDLTHETSPQVPADEALDLTDEAASDTPSDGALELVDETAPDAAASDPARLPGSSSDDRALELTQATASPERANMASGTQPDLESELPVAADQSKGGLDLPQDLTPFMPSKPVEDDAAAPIAEAGYAGAPESVTFTLPENRSASDSPDGASDPVPGETAESDAQTVEGLLGAGAAAPDANQEAEANDAGREPEIADPGPAPERTPGQAILSESGSAELLDPFKIGSDEIDAETSLEIEPVDQAIPAAGEPADSETPAPALMDTPPTHESLVERILRRQMASIDSTEDTDREPAIPDAGEAPREALWATEPPVAPPAATDGDASSAGPDADAVSNDGRDADAIPERAPSPTDPFSDPLFLNELLGDGRFVDTPAQEDDASVRNELPDSADSDSADSDSVSDPAPVAPRPEDEPAPVADWVDAAEDILDVEPEAAPAAPAEPVREDQPEPPVAASSEPETEAASAPEPRPETPVAFEDSVVPDEASDPVCAETPPVPSVVERPTIWQGNSAGERKSRADRNDSVVEPWTPPPGISPREAENAQGAAQQLARELHGAATALQGVLASLDEKIKGRTGLSLEDVGAMRMPDVVGIGDASDRFAVFGADLGREIEDGAAALDNFNHVLDRLAEMAAAQDLDEGWNEIIRQKVSDTHYTVGKILEKVAAAIPPEDTAAEKSKDANAPSATG